MRFVRPKFGAIMERPELTLVDLFAGCGGLSLGLEKAGFTPVFVNELNGDALQTYLQNRRDLNPSLEEAAFHVTDVKMMVAGDYTTKLLRRLKAKYGIKKGELDLLVGGPPCQGFSGIGHRRSYSVDREQLPSNQLFQDMAAVIFRLQPRCFLFENVRGLLNARWTKDGEKGEIWRDVTATFAQLKNYRTAFSLVYAKDYGVPQNRPRVLLVGLRNDVRVENEVDGIHCAITRGFLPKPQGDRPPNLEDLLGDLLDEHYRPGGSTLTYPSNPINGIQAAMRTSHDGRRTYMKGEPITEHCYSNHSARIQAKFSAMLANRGEIPLEYRTKKFAQRVLPARWPDEPTITATSLSDDYVHYCQPRNLTVREWARLQMFPDWYQFAGKRTTGGLRRAGNPRLGIFDREVPKYTQIGNAVPVELARRVGLHLARILRK
jgi:DNA (cytosine-5)-methyltransferase 1